MRRISCVLLTVGLLMAVMSAVTSPVSAQEVGDNPPPDPNAPVTRGEVDAMLNRAEEAVIIAEEAADDAATAIGYANDLFGLFEAMSGAVALVVPFLAIVATVVGFQRLNSAQNELKEARERFEKDIEERSAELDRLREALEDSLETSRSEAGNAALALSLLPLGEKQYKAQDYQGAIDTYKRALELDPDNLITHYRIGYVYTQSGELDDAERHLSRSLDIDATFAPALAARGYVYRRIAEKMDKGIDREALLNQAEENFLRALKQSPKLVDEDSESWWGALGGLYRRRNQTEEAINAYEEGAKVTPHSSYPFSNLALLYMQTENREKMLETYKRVERLAYGEIQAEVDNYWAYADLIVARMALRRVKEAWDELDAALETAPADSPYTLESLIDTLQRLSKVMDNPESIADIDKVVAYIRKFQATHHGPQNGASAEANAGSDTESGA